MINKTTDFRHRPARIGVMLVAACSLLAACGSPEAKAGAAQDSGTASSASKAAPQPAFGLASLMDTTIYDDGYLGLDEYDLIFAPQGQVNAKAIVKSGKSEVASFGFFPDYRFGQGVFGRIKPENLSETTLTPGEYVLEFYVSDELATRMPFKVIANAASDDPFNPQSTVKFVGPWQELAYFTFTPFKDVEAVNLNFWAGASDLEAGKTRAPVQLKLTRNGKLVAHSKETQGMLDHNMLRRHNLTLFQPHERKGEANAELFTKADISQNGNYKLTVALTETGEVIREFAFQSKGGALVPHPRTVMGYKPRADYIAPRVLKSGTTTYEFVEAYWVEAP